MTKEELWNEAKIRVDAFIDTLSQDIRGTLYDRLNQEDVKDFLYGLYIDSAEPREKRIEKLEKKLEQTEKDLADYQFNYPIIKELEQENAELKNRDCWKSCEYANPKSELIAQHIKDVQQLTKAKGIIKKYLSIGVGGKITQNYLDVTKEAEQFLNSEPQSKWINPARTTNDNEIKLNSEVEK